MTARNTLCFFATASAVTMAGAFFVSPALAAPGADYEYAVPAPVMPPPAPPVVFGSNPVVQPLPAAPAMRTMAPPPAPVTEYEYEYETSGPAAYPAPAYSYPAQPYPVQAYPAPYPGAYAPAPQPGYAPPAFDRDAWLDDCTKRIKGTSGKERVDALGYVLGGLAGGVIGNRAWDSERLAGTLIGGGTGALLGGLIGGSIKKSGKDRDVCKAYLDRYMTQYSGGPAHGAYPYPAYGYGQYPAYGYGYQMMMVPVMVTVPQRAVVREYVTEEWVDVPAPRQKVIKYKRPVRKAVPVKRVKTKYIKGN
ncbi:MAG: hypothetical protein ACK5NN_01115 [Sphingomonadaceae bacterium]